ncbi:MAG TPA: heme transporter CcmC [Candidatus Bathyarchaeia archaeon]|nr:heme transporter CcmC [Candidatus Bathyarchaeia archaeon]
MASNLINWRAVIFAMLPIIAIAILSITIAVAFGQTTSPAQTYLNRRVEIWALFYRGMVAAFVVGALVQGAIVYIAWRFRESNRKTWPPKKAEELK